MKYLLAVLCGCSLVLANPAFAQDKKQPSEAQKKQQARMKDCNKHAGDKKLKGDERKAFMSSCLKGEASMGDKATDDRATAQQNKMKVCNQQAGEKKLKGNERKAFMSSCLKG